MTSRIEPLHLAIPDEDLSDLRYRIDRTRWPDKETVDDWSQGAPLAKVKALVEYWGKQALSALNAYVTNESGYAKQQATRPQTVGYGLIDSPAALAAWIYEKFHNWTDCSGDPESVLTLDDMLDNISIYWLTGTGTSSGRTYWHNAGAVAGGFAGPVLDIPVGCSIFPREIYRAPRRWAERKYKNLIYWNEPARGGHFAAFEQPAIFTDELRNCFRSTRAN